MVSMQGKLLASGTIQDLKERFEAGYQLTLRHSVQGLWDGRVSDHIRTHFPAMVAKSPSAREDKTDPEDKVSSKYHLPIIGGGGEDAERLIGRLLESLERPEVKQQLQLEGYSLDCISLEQIFISMVKNEELRR